MRGLFRFDERSGSARLGAICWGRSIVSEAAQRLQGAYAIISGDDDADRICDAIPDSACRQAPRNYMLNLANGAASKLAEQLAGPRLVLPWLLGAAGASTMAVSALMPIKQAAGLLPQLLVAGALRARPRRKGFWVAAGCLQALCLLLMVPAMLGLAPGPMALAVLGLLAVFSMASGVASVAFQDVLAKTIGKGVRGGLLANRAMVGGLLALGAGLGIELLSKGEAAELAVVGLLGGAALLWLLAALCFAFTVEAAGATEGGRNPMDETRAGIALTRGEPLYRRYLGVRFLLLPVELAAPLFVLLAQTDGGVGLLGLLVAAMALADVFSSRLWGGLADRHAGRVLALSGAVGAASAVLLLLMQLLPGLPTATLALPFVLLGVAEAGVRLGRKTWLVDAAAASTRPTAVAFGNTATGVAALVFSGLGVFGLLGAAAPVAAVAALAAVGGLLALGLPAEAKIGGEDSAAR
jgi:hypothetical protein